MEKELLAQSSSTVGIGHLSTRGPHSVSGIFSESSNKITYLQSFNSEPAEAVPLPGTHSCTKTCKPNFSPPHPPGVGGAGTQGITPLSTAVWSMHSGTQEHRSIRCGVGTFRLWANCHCDLRDLKQVEGT